MSKRRGQGNDDMKMSAKLRRTLMMDRLALYVVVVVGSSLFGNEFLSVRIAPQLAGELAYDAGLSLSLSLGSPECY